uniref:Uncharacterized protein n=1 Tax=Myoviridae sp. ctq9w2 TaxID=2825177 RepID=A0A8S5PX42_9CAUD|nr:MAG TPA: hypothetical protein [Myoviridae sp. ctq9w2]
MLFFTVFFDISICKTNTPCKNMKTYGRKCK